LYDEAVRLSHLVEDLRILSLADAGELSLNKRGMEPAALLERAMAANAPKLQQKGITPHTEIGTDLPDVNVDPERMAQVLNNLIDNAGRHTPEGGSVTGKVRVMHPARVLFTIEDTGPGVAAVDVPNIFERFYRADKSRQHDSSGSGLGLAIAKSIVEAHGGKIWVESPAGAGAKFFIELPASVSTR